MKVTDYILNKIDRLPKGYVFTYGDFTDEVDSKGAIVKALNRMVKASKINKLSKGRFYKPEKTPFGDLEPDEYQIAKDLLEKNGKPIGYITGFGIYNKLGLTTQMSFVIQIGRNETRPSLKRGRYRISFIKQKNTITKENIPLLQILDAIRYIKKIPDTDTEFLIKRFLQIIKNLSDKDQALIIRLSLKYPPATRALLGAFLDELGIDGYQNVLKKSLNQLSDYKLGIPEQILSSVIKWNIK